jgi:hypothetical protein
VPPTLTECNDTLHRLDLGPTVGAIGCHSTRPHLDSERLFQTRGYLLTLTYESG